MDHHNTFLPKLYTEQKHAEERRRDMDKGWGKFEVVRVELKPIRIATTAGNRS